MIRRPYKDGWNAYLEGNSLQTNPYNENDEHEAFYEWDAGWYDSLDGRPRRKKEDRDQDTHGEGDLVHA